MADKHGDSLDWYLVEAPLEELEKAFGVTKASFGMVLPEQWHSTHEKAMRLIDATDVDTITEQHMKDNLLPLVGVLTVDNYMHFFKAGDGAKVVKLISKDAYAKDVIAPIVEEFRSVAAKFTAPKIFFWVEPLQEYTMNQFGFDPEQKEKPLVGFLDQGTGQKYRMEGDFSATTLETFVKGVESGEIAAYSKSEALPDPPVEGKVAKIVGKNFKKLAPVWEDLAAQKIPGVTIGHFDATANDFVDTQTQGMVQGYPTLLFYPAGKGSAPVPYSGGRDLEALKAFVMEKAGAAAPAAPAAGEKEL